MQRYARQVADVRYFGSQPWPFPHSFMIAFTATHAGGQLTPESSELEDAGWFTLENLPPVPPRISIARQLIDGWVARRGGDPRLVRTVG